MDQFTLNYNLKEKFFHIILYGDIFIHDYIKLFNMVSSFNNDFTSDLKILYERTNAHSAFSEYKLDEIIKPFEKLLRNYKNVKIAELVSSPHDTAIALIFHFDTKHLSNFKHHIFQSRANALNWLEINKKEIISFRSYNFNKG